MNMHKDILHAALSIVIEKGHQSLSLRRLANNIEFSATAMYLYFKNKEALLVDLTKLGYQQLNTSIDRNCKSIIEPRNRLKAMLKTYLFFKRKTLLTQLTAQMIYLSDRRRPLV